MAAVALRIVSTIRRRRPGALDVYFGADEGRPVTEHEFFDSLRMPNGTWKTSSDCRLDDLNDLVAPLLPADRPIAVMDVAVGSGISTLEWADHLSAHARQARMLAGDLYAWGWLVTCGTRCAILHLEDGMPLTFELCGRVVNLRSERVVVRGLRWWAAALFRHQTGREPAALAAPPRRGRLIHRRIPLVSPRLLRRGDLEVVTDDLSDAGRYAGSFDVVRAANILNRAYFDDRTLSLFAANLIERVNEGGLLAVGRTRDDGTNDATVFRRVNGSMKVQARLGAGSEVEDLVLSSSLPRSS